MDTIKACEPADMPLADPRSAHAFYCVRRSYRHGVARLYYRFDNGPEMCEEIVFPNAPEVPYERRAAFDQALDWLHWVAGISYYKAGVPEHIHCPVHAPNARAEALLQSIYGYGLAEFSYRNHLALERPLIWQTSSQASQSPYSQNLDLPERVLVPIGGGKDSLVVIEALKHMDAEMMLAFVGTSPLIEACAKRSGVPFIQIKRRLATELFGYNRQGAYNGHIPITAINSAILVVAAIIYGYNAIAFANERSASAATLDVDGYKVNHQWSKGIDFEKNYAAYVHDYVARDLDYFSLLRPFSELAVMRAFASWGQPYHGTFSSCNRNFKLTGDKPQDRWCGACPKCHFVFLGLACFLPKQEVMHIFGSNPLNNNDFKDDLDALLEYKNHKPFECVGEGHEARAALWALSQRPEWQNDALVARFVDEIAPTLDAADKDLPPWLVASNQRHIPPRFMDAYHAISNA